MWHLFEPRDIFSGFRRGLNQGPLYLQESILGRVMVDSQSSWPWWLLLDALRESLGWVFWYFDGLVYVSCLNCLCNFFLGYSLPSLKIDQNRHVCHVSMMNNGFEFLHRFSVCKWTWCNLIEGGGHIYICILIGMRSCTKHTATYRNKT